MAIVGWIFMIILAAAALVAVRLWWAWRNLGEGMRFYKGNTYTEAEYQEVRKREGKT